MLQSAMLADRSATRRGAYKLLCLVLILLTLALSLVALPALAPGQRDALIAPAVAADVMLDVPAFDQRDYPGDLRGVPNRFADYGDGVTSIAMVFRYYGVDTDPRRSNTALREVGGFDFFLLDQLTWSPSSINSASAG